MTVRLPFRFPLHSRSCATPTLITRASPVVELYIVLLDAITERVQRPNNSVFLSIARGPNQPITKEIASADGGLMRRLMGLAHLSGHDNLSETMAQLLRDFMDRSLQFAHLAMTLADEFDLKYLRGAAYFEVMQNMGR